MKLPVAPAQYDPADQTRLRTLLERNDATALHTSRDVQLVNGERLILGSAANLTAHAGGGQAGALQLSADVNHVGSVASVADSVALPPAVAGRRITVINSGTHALQAFGLGSDTINGIASGTGVAQAAGVTATYNCALAGAWFV